MTCAHDARTLTKALNAHLPADVRVVSVEDADEAFHARFSASGKTYRYQIRNTAIADPFDRAFVWHLPEPLSLDALAGAAALLVGTHDFGAFRSVGSEVAATMCRALSSISLKLSRPTSVNPPTAVDEPEPLT